MKSGVLVLWSVLFLFVFLSFRNTGVARTPSASMPQVGSSTASIKKTNQQHDSFTLKTTADLLLRPEGWPFKTRVARSRFANTAG